MCYKESSGKDVQKTLLISWLIELKLYRLNFMEKEFAGIITPTPASTPNPAPAPDPDPTLKL